MKTWLYLLVCVLGVLSRIPSALGAQSGRNTYVVSWDLQPMSNYVVTVEMISTAYGTTSWSTNVTDVNSIEVSTRAKSPSFSAYISGQTAELSWGYTGTNSSGLLFNLYEAPTGETNWSPVTNFPGVLRVARCFLHDPSGYVTMTASNFLLKVESAASNVAGWTNNVGQQIPVQVTTVR